MADYQRLYQAFLSSSDKLQVYDQGTLVFTSDREMLVPLLNYLATKSAGHKDVTVFDKIMGNAAALLCIMAKSHEVYSPLGSELAVKTLDKHGIVHHIATIVPFIQRPGTTEICPMEKLSTGKEPEEFYRAVTQAKPGNC
jgi:hypothetical protein